MQKEKSENIYTREMSLCKYGEILSNAHCSGRLVLETPRRRSQSAPSSYRGPVARLADSDPDTVIEVRSDPDTV